MSMFEPLPKGPNFGRRAKEKGGLDAAQHVLPILSRSRAAAGSSACDAYAASTPTMFSRLPVASAAAAASTMAVGAPELERCLVDATGHPLSTHGIVLIPAALPRTRARHPARKQRVPISARAETCGAASPVSVARTCRCT